MYIIFQLNVDTLKIGTYTLKVPMNVVSGCKEVKRYHFYG